MSISLKEFFRLLPFALKNHEYEINHRNIVVHLNSAVIIITVEELNERKIASLSLPVLKLAFTFANLNHEQKQSFLKQFSRAYQRGGG